MGVKLVKSSAHADAEKRVRTAAMTDGKKENRELWSQAEKLPEWECNRPDVERENGRLQKHQASELSFSINTGLSLSID